MSQENKGFTIVTVEGSTDLSQVMPDDLVLFRTESNLKGLSFRAGEILTEGRTPIHEAKDGSTRRLDGAYVAKLGGEVMGVTRLNTSR